MHKLWKYIALVKDTVESLKIIVCMSKGAFTPQYKNESSEKTIGGLSVLAPEDDMYDQNKYSVVVVTHRS